jgi:hypothetical protein
MTLDVRARLAQGAAAVADSPQQIHDWYYAEDGLRLDTLDADAAALTAASAGAEEALRIHREALDLLSHSWRGGSGSGAGEFLARQSAAAAGIVASLRSAAAALTALRVGLEQLVNAKVDAARSGDWSAVTGSGTEAAVAYDVAVSRLGELPTARFETPACPAELTPQQPQALPPVPQPVPDQAPAPVSAPVPAPVSAPMAAPVSAPVSPMPGQGWTSGAPVGALPGVPDIGGSLAGLVTWIAQTLGSYADAPTAGGIADTTDVTTPGNPVDEVKPVVPEQYSSPTTLPVAKVPAPAAEVPAPVFAAEAPAAEVPAAEIPAPPPPPTAPPPPAPPAPPAAADVATPCEIAADELPRVGQ